MNKIRLLIAYGRAVLITDEAIDTARVHEITQATRQALDAVLQRFTNDLVIA